MRLDKPFICFILALFLIMGQVSFAQLPDPTTLCSHSKTSKEKTRQAKIDYSQFDEFDVSFYKLDIHLETENTFIEGYVDIYAQAISEIDTLYLELSHVLSVDSVFINDKKVNFIHNSDDIIKVLPTAKLSEGESFISRVYYQGTAIDAGGERGYLSENSNHGTQVNWTLSEPFYSKDWWPCKQDLLDKADSVWVFVTTSNKNKVGSNGLLTATVELENENVRYEWKSKYPIAYYLISIALAEYMEYSFSTPELNGKQVWIQNYLYPDSAMYKSQKALIDCTKIQMNLLREKYGEYPFIDEKYGHSISGIGGGMEHQTMTTQVNFSFHLTIHEMGHSWFGDNVTCATWNHIWLNEGFATYTQYLGLEKFSGEASANGFLAAMQSVVMREPDGSVFVPNEFINDRSRIFSGRLSYYKGATVIHMIRYILNDDDLFFHILREYQSRFAYQTATTEDFQDVLEDLSGKDFDSFFDLWIYGEGYPIYQFEWEQNVNNKLIVYSTQESSAEITPFFEMDFDTQIFFTDGSSSMITIHQKEKEEKISVNLDKRVKAVIPNPNSSNLMQVKGVYSGMNLPGTIKIEPNPAHDFVLVNFANHQPYRKIHVLNSALQLVEEIDAVEKQMRLNISFYPLGIYFILSINAGKQSLVKFVKY